MCFNMVNVNVNGSMFVARYFLGKFKERFEKHGKKSAIINVASVCAFKPSAMITVYSATKAFNENLSKGMAKEYSQYGVDVMTVLPNSVRTSMNSGMYFGTITAEQHGKAVIDQLGWESWTLGHWIHGLNNNLGDFWPSAYIIGRINLRRKLEFMRLREEDIKK